MKGDNVAVRAPVRIAAKWLARLEAGAPLIRMISLVITGLSTLLITLKQYGYGEYAGYVLVVGGPLGALFVYVYTDGGIYNTQKRDRAEFGDNFAGPGSRIDDEMISRGVIAGKKGEPLNTEEREAIQNELDHAYADLRDGIPIERTRGD